MNLFGLFKGRKKRDDTPELAAGDATGDATGDTTGIPPGSTGIPPGIHRDARPGDDAGALESGLARTRGRMAGGLRALFGGRALDDELLESIEEELLLADVGVAATGRIVETLRREAKRARSADEVRAVLRRTLVELLTPAATGGREPPPGKPWVMLVVGVNGSGKTTTIGKLAQKLRHEGHSVLLAAGDTFRAAAVEQLQRWGERAGVPVIAQKTGADAAAVIHDALAHASARGADVVLADTAGRLHTQSNLMDELRKVRRVITRFDETAPHETLLVLDGGSGQNAIAQARQFGEAVDVTGLALTKLDGTAKGGVAFAVVAETGLPIRFIGVGERPEDLRPFDPEAFVDALLGDDEAAEENRE
ncbi:MAG: signal recognition particle-docking protein FtsY [Halofilum sp. (in: g-proteobacteria)]|nr:signal recognition particle-docking protein FtsY [Halofilum sp. (in: g-proteobacteria)]